MEWASFFIGAMTGAVIGVGVCAYWAYTSMFTEITDGHEDTDNCRG